MKKTAFLLLALGILFSCTPKVQEKEISYDELRDKIAGAWLGQMVGNIYGLEYENDFVDEPGPDGPFIFEKSMTKMAAVDGAFSDDDTDVEYLYLMMGIPFLVNLFITSLSYYFAIFLVKREPTTNCIS